MDPRPITCNVAVGDEEIDIAETNINSLPSPGTLSASVDEQQDSLIHRSLDDILDYHASLRENVQKRREDSETMLEQLAEQHAKLLQEVSTVITPYQQLPNVIKRSSSEPASPSRFNIISPRTTRRENVPRRLHNVDDSTSLSMVVVPSETSGSSATHSPRTPHTLTRKSPLTRSDSLSTEERLLMDVCTFQPVIIKSRHSSSAPPPQSRPTRASILRDVAIKIKGEKTSDDFSVSSFSTPPGSPGSRSTSSLLSRSSRKALEGYRKEEADAIYGAEKRRAEIRLSYNAGAHRRALSSLRKAAQARDDREERQAILDQCKGETSQEHLMRQQSVERIAEQRKNSIKEASLAMQEERRLNGKAIRRKSQEHRHTIKIEEGALLDERRRLVKQIQDLEARQAKALQQRREYEIQCKRREISKLRNEFVEQHRVMVESSEQELDEKREHERSERGRKYEDLLVRAQQLEHLRLLDKQLNSQLRAESESQKALRDQRYQEAKEQASEAMQMQYHQRKQELAEAETRLSRRSSRSSPQPAPLQEESVEVYPQPTDAPQRTSPQTTHSQAKRSEIGAHPISELQTLRAQPKDVHASPQRRISKGSSTESPQKPSPATLSARTRKLQLGSPRPRSSSCDRKALRLKNTTTSAFALNADVSTSPNALTATSLASAFEAVTRQTCDPKSPTATVDNLGASNSTVAEKMPAIAPQAPSAPTRPKSTVAVGALAGALASVPILAPSSSTPALHPMRSPKALGSKVPLVVKASSPKVTAVGDPEHGRKHSQMSDGSLSSSAADAYHAQTSLSNNPIGNISSASSLGASLTNISPTGSVVLACSSGESGSCPLIAQDLSGCPQALIYKP